jgi:hypothetical protein
MTSMESSLIILLPSTFLSTIVRDYTHLRVTHPSTHALRRSTIVSTHIAVIITADPTHQ